MKILQIQKFNYLLGGGSRYYFELTKLLQRHGHQISQFCVDHPDNLPSRFQRYFISNVSYEKNDLVSRLKLFGRMLYSVEAKTKIKQLLSDLRPDIVHIHDIHHHISPSILPVIKQLSIPIVQHLGDYHLISPNYHMFHDGRICEITKPDRYYRAFFHRCVKSSYTASFAELTEKYLHNLLGWERNLIDCFIVPSLFMKNKLIEYGVDPDKIECVPHFIDVSSYKTNYNAGAFILYFGRLSPEKGLEILLEAMSQLPDIPLIIAGRGPHEEALKERVRHLGMQNVRFAGFKDGNALKRLIAGGRFTVLPSIWYEVFGLSILESFACGKPVIASRIGGIPEVITDSYNGFLVQPGSSEKLAEKIAYLWSSPSLCLRMGKNARNTTIKTFNPSQHYRRLLTLYQKALQLTK